ncbi:MAG: protein translocase subunit SecD [Myxococcales bacterium]|nr:protein translocase subunit SecD [Myxococcales bacterium]
MIFKVLAASFAAIALLSVAGAYLKRPKRSVLIWAVVSASFAAGGAYYQSFWPTVGAGLLVVWALIAATNSVTFAWRVKVGMTLAIAVVVMLALFPTIHDEGVCSRTKPVAELRSSCPEVLKQMPSEARDEHMKLAALGEKGFTQFLLQNIGFRLVRGLDLAGGLRLVYNVQVDEAIRDKRDRYYDQLRASMTKQLGLSALDAPTVPEMAKLADKVKLHKPREQSDIITATFQDTADTTKALEDAFIAPFLRELTLLRGADGKAVTFRIRNEVGADVRDRAVQQAKETIHRRIDGLGVKEAAISVRDEDIIIEVPGNQEKEFDRIRELISETARLEFKLLDDAANFFEPIASSPEASLPVGMRFEVENAPLGLGEGGGQRSAPSYFARLNKLDGETIEETLKRMREWAATLQIDEDHEVGFGKVYEVNPDTEQYELVGWRTYFLKAKAELTGDMVRDALASSDQNDAGLGGWHVQMTMTPLGAERFEAITAANVKKRFAIILDAKVESAPVINEAIGGGTARITMGSGNLQQQLEDSRKLELVLRSGALPAPISLSNEQRIGALLGQDAIDDGIKAASVGGLLVVLFMFWQYRWSGGIASLAVAFNLLLQLAILAMFNASMTLPGLAGLALTVGMAVDANVLINERIREEVLAGKSARAAVSLGYDRAFSAIFDGNATTLIAGLIMAQYGSGPIKGFAITLIVGMATNLFTGVVATKLLFEWWVNSSRGMKLSIG